MAFELGNIATNLKGNIAESLVEDLLRGSCRMVHRRGHCWYAQQKNKVTQHNRRPDFTIINQAQEREYLEVKFRCNGSFDPKDDKWLILLREEDQWRPKIVLVSYVAPYFQVIHRPYELNDRRPTRIRYITGEGAWCVSQKKLNECIRYLYRIRSVLP